jgi:hypothetical protein
MLFQPPLEMSVDFVLNMVLGNSKEPLTPTRLKQAQKLLDLGPVEAILTAQSIYTDLKRDGEEITQTQANLGNSLLPLARAYARLLPLIMNDAGIKRIEKSLPGFKMGTCAWRSKLIKNNPVLICYVTRICIGHPENGELGTTGKNPGEKKINSGISRNLL